jgi:putative ABC transport system permease protein
MYLVVAASVEPGTLIGPMRTELEKLERNQTVLAVTTFEDLLAWNLSSRRMFGQLLGFLGMVGLVMVSMAIYGVIAYSVAQRTREIGIRTALGARHTSIVRMIVLEGMRLTAAGILLGFLGSAGANRILARYLYGVTSFDPVTLTATAALFALISFIAAWAPHAGQRILIRSTPYVAISSRPLSERLGRS